MALTKHDIESLRQMTEKCACFDESGIVEVPAETILELLDERDDVLAMAEDLDAKDSEIANLKEELLESKNEIRELMAGLDDSGVEEDLYA